MPFVATSLYSKIRIQHIHNNGGSWVGWGCLQSILVDKSRPLTSEFSSSDTGCYDDPGVRCVISAC